MKVILSFFFLYLELTIFEIAFNICRLWTLEGSGGLCHRVIQYLLYITQYTLHNIHYTIYITQYTLHNIYYTIYITQYTVYSVVPFTSQHHCGGGEGERNRLPRVYMSEWVSF
jgi:hypothetical protein